MTRTPEGQLEDVATEIFKKHGIKWRKYGNYNHGQYKNKKGSFDFLISGGKLKKKLIWIEFKIRPRKPSPEQIEFQRWIVQNNGKAYVVYGVSELAKILAFERLV
jgi:hypothetical protein